MNEKTDRYIMGKKLIIAGIQLDEGLADLLKFQVKLLKRLANSDSPIDEIQKANTLLRNIIIALSMTEEKIRCGLSLCGEDSKEEL